ncbi:MAG: AAA family ATPase [Geminicoccus sp.]|nr:AAA family ATPase [Geminicoccus sp.]
MNTDTINDATSDTAEDHVATDAAVEAAGAETVVAAAPAAAPAEHLRLDQASIDHFGARFHAIAAEVRKDILSPEGAEDFVGELLTALFAKGHVLLESRPGLGKTTLVRSLGAALGLQFGRVQFTPDLMPADITGTTILRTDERGGLYPEFQSGPIFANILLADEINRASPKTQAALLEAMAERQMTVAGVTYKPGQNYDAGNDVASPMTGTDASGLFHVLATQNPIEQEGTYPLPEAQLDRFFFKLVIPSPDDALLSGIVTHTTGVQREVLDTAQHVDGLTFEELQYLQSLPLLVETPESALQFAVELCQTLNPVSGRPSALNAANEYVMYGPSPRGAQALILAAKVRALVAGMPNINADLIAQVAGPALRHRVILNHRAAIDGMDSDRLIADAVSHLGR